MVLNAVLIGGVLPWILCTFLLLIGWFRARTSPDKKGPRWLMPLLVVLSIIPAELFMNEWKTQLWPVSAPDRMPHIALALAMLGVLHALLDGYRITKWIVPLIAVGVADWMLLSYRMHPGFWTPSESVRLMSVFILIGYLVTRAVEHTASKPAGSGPVIPCILFIAATALSVILMTTGSAYMSAICGGVAACLMAALIASLLIPRFSLAGGAITALLPMLSVLRLGGIYLAPGYEPKREMLLVLVGPVVACAALLTVLKNMGTWKRLIVASIVTGIFCGTGVALLALHADKKPGSDSSQSTTNQNTAAD